MTNIVALGAGRDRPRRFGEVAREGARILFFTGVRYVRVDDDEPPHVSEGERFCELSTAPGLVAIAATRHVPA